MTVFVVQKPKPGPSGNTYDVSPATEYGEIIFIFDAYENPSANPVSSLQKIRTVLESKFNPDSDYVVWAGGDPYGLFLVGFVVCESNLPLRWLRFERLRTRPQVSDPTNPHQIVKSGYYLPVEMPASVY